MEPSIEKGRVEETRLRLFVPLGIVAALEMEIRPRKVTRRSFKIDIVRRL